MKILRLSLMVALIASFSVTSFAIHSSKSNKKKYSKKYSNPQKAAEYRRYAQTYSQKAAKAEAQGKKDLAKLYSECARCKSIMADGFAGKVSKSKINSAYRDYRSARNKIKRLEEKYKKTKKTDYTKKSSASTKDKYNKNAAYAEKCKKYSASAAASAKQYREKGLNDKAEYMEKCSELYKKIGEGYKSNDMNAVHESIREYKKLKAEFMAKQKSEYKQKKAGVSSSESKLGKEKL